MPEVMALEKRVCSIEEEIKSFNERWFAWVQNHEEKRKQFEDSMYNRLQEVIKEIQKYNEYNMVHVEQIKNLQKEDTILKESCKQHEKIITQSEIYLKGILEELKTVNLSVMKKDIDALHNKTRDQEKEIKEFKKQHEEELQEFREEVRNTVTEIKKDIEIIKNTAGKIALKLWIWVISIIGTATITGIISYFISR